MFLRDLVSRFVFLRIFIIGNSAAIRYISKLFLVLLSFNKRIISFLNSKCVFVCTKCCSNACMCFLKVKVRVRSLLLLHLHIYPLPFALTCTLVRVKSDCIRNCTPKLYPICITLFYPNCTWISFRFLTFLFISNHSWQTKLHPLPYPLPLPLPG